MNKKAWYTARTITVLSFLTSMVILFMWSGEVYVTLWQWYFFVISSAFFMMVMLAFRKMPVYLAGLICLACACIELFASTVTNLELSAAHVHYDPFQSCKLIALVFAIVAVAPSWVGFFVIGMCGITPVILYYALSEDFRSGMGVQEPWLTLFYAIVALAVFIHQLKSSELEQKYMQVQAQKTALDHVAKAMLALRDLSNTPIQAITATTAMLQEEKISRIEIARINHLALDRLAEISQMMAIYEHQVDWSKIDSSFDSMMVLKEVLSGSKGSDALL